MIPLKDENPTTRFPIITIILIGLNILVFLFQSTLSAQAEFYFIHRFGAIPVSLLKFLDPFPNDGLPFWITPVTSVFLHGGVMHLAGNMLFLWIFGNNIEDRIGRVRFILFYFICGTAATLAHALADPHSIQPLVGASGAISGVMGAYLVLYPRARVLTLILIIIYPVFIWVPAVFFLLFWLVFQVVRALGSDSGNVAWMAHIGGFICGAVLVKLLAGPAPEGTRRPPLPAGPGRTLKP